jgi:cyclohexa-1,5-dienecarbonyl-CoA hydratase
MSELKYHTFKKADGVARLTFNRPKHNVLNIDMMKEFNHQLEALLSDTGLKCLVIGAEGPSWCAGVEVADHKPEMVEAMIRTFNRIFELLDRCEVPTVAAVNGACLGGGMEVAIACDIVLASERSVFGQPEIKLGFLPPYAAIRLPQLVGPSKAVEICVTGRRYTAKEARAMGLINHCLPTEGFADEAAKIVEEIAYSSPLIIRLNKRAVKQHLGMRFQEALEGVSDLFLHGLMQTEDTLEGIASFEEKRKPAWKNR